MSNQMGETSPLLAQPRAESPSQNHGARSRRLPYTALSETPDAKVDSERIGGPVSFLNSTHARFSLPYAQPADASANSTSNDGNQSSAHHQPVLEWRARDNRKGRHRLIISHRNQSPQPSNNGTSVLQGIWRMFTVIAYWDISWWIGIFFSIGCMLFIVTGVLQVSQQRGLKLDADVSEWIAGVAACIGATLFAFAGVLLVLEATNENQAGCFGWAIEDTLSGESEGEGQNLIPKRQSNDSAGSFRVRRLECQHPHHRLHRDSPRTWKWWPSWQELHSHHLHDLGFLANFILAIGTIIFWISGILSIPALSDRLSVPAMKWTYWLAFFVGGLHFATASILYMLESQDVWYKPNLQSLGWWIGLWDLIGSLGWILSASLGGYCSLGVCQFQSDVSLLWASIAFEIGSLLLWYEAVDKYPVQRSVEK